MPQNELKWKSFEVSPTLFSAGKLNDILVVFNEHWAKLRNPNLCALFNDRNSHDRYYVASKDPSIWTALSSEVTLQEFDPPPSLELVFMAGDSSPFYRES